MTNRDLIVDFVNRFPGRDDDEISATLRILPRQSVNQICRRLELAGIIERRLGDSGKISNYPGRNKSESVFLARSVPTSVDSMPADVTNDWFWEGNVAECVADWLRSEGWTLISQADTRTRQRGVDIHASRDNREILVEAKGYPSHSYRDERRAGEQKKTNPALQANHWYAHALLKSVRLQSGHPSALVAMALPSFETYRKLFRESELALTKLGIAVIFVSESGKIEAVGL